MKRISTFAVSFIFAAIFAVSAFGQGAAQPGPGKIGQGAAQPAAGKIGWIDTGMFSEEKEGVTKYLGSLKALQTEMKPRLTELQTLDGRIKVIADDLNKAPNPAVPFDPKTRQAKQDEGQRLQREFEFKKKEYDAIAAKRGSEVLGPVQADIFRAIQEFAKQKGYAAILDIAVLANENFNAILALDQSLNITKEFITFYNTRPASTATTAAPR